MSHTVSTDDEPASLPVAASDAVAPSPAGASVLASVEPSLTGASVPESPAGGTARGQSELVLQPGEHAVPAQYSPVGQLSFDGRHWTQVFDVVSHQGSAPWHCELTRHWTQAPALHTSPDGHGWVAVQPGTQASAWHTSPAGQSPSARHATHVSVVVSHLGVGAEQFVSARHPTQALLGASQTCPVGHVLFASQPFAHALATQR